MSSISDSEKEEKWTQSVTILNSITTIIERSVYDTYLFYFKDDMNTKFNVGL